MKSLELQIVLFCLIALPPICFSVDSPAHPDQPPSPFPVGVLLDLETPIGKIFRLCMNMAVSDFYAANSNFTTRLDLRFRNSRQDPFAAAAAAVDLLKLDRVHAIIGPQTSDEAAFIADLGSRVGIPIVSFSATSPSLSAKKAPFFVRAALDDSFQATPMASLVAAYGWRNVALIYEESEFGTGMVPYIVDSITAVGSRVASRLTLNLTASDESILKELYKLMTMESRVFIVHVSPPLYTRLLPLASQAGMMSKGFAWMLSGGLTSLLSIMDHHLLHGAMDTSMIGVKPYVEETEKLLNFTARWREEFKKENPKSEISEPSVMGLWAYDTVSLMAMAAESVGAADPGYGFPGAAEHFTDLGAIGVSRPGSMLLQAIKSAELNGLSGKFRLGDGQLSPPALQIVNLHQQQEKTLGFWTPEGGLVETLNMEKRKPSLPTTSANLSLASWPGGTKIIPKGWDKPAVAERLRVLVPDPVDQGFPSLVTVRVNNVTRETLVSGFVFDVFEEVLKELPYALPIEYLTAGPDKTNRKYNDLVDKVFKKEYDALVGDVTITFNRSIKVDFTLPFISTGVSMVVPQRDDRRSSAWIFLRPLTWELWLASGIFFLLTGSIVWTLEHRVNEEFRGSPGHQVGTLLYYIFSTLVFSQREKMKSNLARVVVVIWLFVVFVLQSSYTASLTSMLAVRRLKPTALEIEDFLHGQEYVGYLEYSFVKDMLKDLGFREERLRPYKSIEAYQEALSRGSRNGGVSAVVDEVPNLKAFLQVYCANYTMVGKVHRVGGFGFVFPKGSPLVADISEGILKVTEGEKIKNMEKKWFGDQNSCPSPENKLNSDSLNLSSFWGPFLITGIASAVALVSYLFIFLYEELCRRKNLASGRLVFPRLASVAKHYDEKDYSSHHFRNWPKSEISGNRGHGFASPSSSGSKTPASIRTEYKVEEGTPPLELCSPLSTESSPRFTRLG